MCDFYLKSESAGSELIQHMIELRVSGTEEHKSIRPLGTLNPFPWYTALLQSNSMH